MEPTLFDLAPLTAPARQWGRWFPVPAPARCPRGTCGTPLVAVPAVTQPAIVHHGGYGAAERTTRETCPGCGMTRTIAVESVNPRHLDAA